MLGTHSQNNKCTLLKKCLSFSHTDIDRIVLFEFNLKFWNTASIGIPVRSLNKKEHLLDGIQIKHL